MIERLDEIWAAPEAPATLSTAVLDRLAARRARRDRSRSIAAGAAVAALAAGLLLALWPSPSPRAVDIEHTAGYAVYRARSPVTVRTPAGAVHARAAHFSVEVEPMKRELMSAAGGAAVAVAVVVVYKGSVTAESDRGDVTVEAGEQAELRAGAPIAVSDAELEPPPASATREQLLARDRMLVRRVTALSSRVTELEGKLASAAASSKPGDGPDPDKFLDLSESELAILADRCELRYDIPGYAMSRDVDAIMKHINRYEGLSDDERAAFDRIMRAGDPQLIATLRSIYIEVTGDRAGAETLSLRNMQHEVFEKSAPGDVNEALRLISAERAGRAEPPVDLAGRPPVERMLRALAASGARLERALAAEVGPERARQLRKERVAWARRRQSGCPD